MTAEATTTIPTTPDGAPDGPDFDGPAFEAEVGAYAERILSIGLASLEATTIHLGRRLGLYEALAGGPRTSGEVAATAGIHPRYAREWLEQQATAGLVETAGGDGGADRTFWLSPAAVECLLRPDSLASVGPVVDLAPLVPAILPLLEEAFRTGGGVPYAAYGIHDVQGEFNRPAFVNLLAADWVPRVPGLAERLEAGARVAELGCGEGWAAIALAQAFPAVEVDGFDLDEASVAEARKKAAEAGVTDRVRFEVADVTTDVPGAAGVYDVVLAFEMVHDLARPVEALAQMRRIGRPGAIRVVMDERTADDLDPGTENPVERLLYAASVLHCLPVGMSESPSAATGTVMRPATFRRYAESAGFGGVEVLPIDHDLFRFYLLVD